MLEVFKVCQWSPEPIELPSLTHFGRSNLTAIIILVCVYRPAKGPLLVIDSDWDIIRNLNSILLGPLTVLLSIKLKPVAVSPSEFIWHKK